MKIISRALYAIRRSVRRLLAPAHPLARRLRVDVKQECKVRLQPIARKVVRLAHDAERKTASIPLVGDRRIAEPVGDDPCSGGKRRTYDILHELCARGEEKKKLGPVARRVFGFILQKRADLLGEARSAGLAREEDRDALPFKRGLQPLHLRGLSAALAALEGYELPLRHHSSTVSSLWYTGSWRKGTANARIVIAVAYGSVRSLPCSGHAPVGRCRGR